MTNQPPSRRHFLLLEVLLALTLLTLCAFPLIRAQVALLRGELETLRELQLEHHAHAAYYTLLERCYTHEIDWKFPSSGELGTVDIALPGNRTDSYQCRYSLSELEKRRKGDRATYRLLGVNIHLAPINRPQKRRSYAYQLCLKRRNIGHDEPPSP